MRVEFLRINNLNLSEIYLREAYQRWKDVITNRCITWLKYPPEKLPFIIEYGNGCFENYLNFYQSTDEEIEGLLSGDVVVMDDGMIATCDFDFCNDDRLDEYVSDFSMC